MCTALKRDERGENGVRAASPRLVLARRIAVQQIGKDRPLKWGLASKPHSLDYFQGTACNRHQSADCHGGRMRLRVVDLSLPRTCQSSSQH